MSPKLNASAARTLNLIVLQSPNKLERSGRINIKHVLKSTIMLSLCHSRTSRRSTLKINGVVNYIRT